MPIESPKAASPALSGARHADSGSNVPALKVAELPPAVSLWPALTPEAVRGWVSSLALHGALLLVLALWYFGPSPSGPHDFDGRLAGSEMGVDEGLTTTGGLNTELTMPVAEAEPTKPLFTTLAIPDLTSLDARFQNFAGSDKPSAGGGLDFNNPGAGEGDGFGLAKFGQGGENIRGVEVKVGDPQFTLIWDTEVDLDLHVVEPGGKEIYWEDPKGRRGGELDVDNTRGFGPENIYWLEDAGGTGQKKVKGQGPAGEYEWFVVYWGGFGGIPKPTHWKVRIKHDGKVTVVSGKLNRLNARSRVYHLTVEPTRAAASTTNPSR
jgi:hypothetical protein